MAAGVDRVALVTGAGRVDGGRDDGIPSWVLPAAVGVWIGGALLVLAAGELRERSRLRRYRRG